MQELSQDHNFKALFDQLSQDHMRLDQEYQVFVKSLASERARSEQTIQEMLETHQLQRSDEQREWAEKSKSELVKFQRDSDELYQRCSESFDEIHDGMETAQEELRQSQASLDEISAGLTASVDGSVSRESQLHDRLLEALETRLKESLDQFDLVKVAISRLMELNMELKGQVKSHSAVIKGLEEYRDQMIAKRVLESHTEVLAQLKDQTDEMQRVDSRGGDLVSQIDTLRRELSEEKRKQNMNVIIAALVGVVGWFF
jgi:hypothetical protein